MRGTGHRDETGDHKYFSEIPHLLDDSELTAYEVRLYLHYKRVCSPNDVCYESVRTSAAKCRMDPHSIIRARNVLAEKGWITVELGGTGRGHTVSVTLIDRWRENMERYSKGGTTLRLPEKRSPMPRNVADIQQKRGTDANKEEPIKKNHEEDHVPYGGGAAPGAQAKTPTALTSTDGSSVPAGTAVDIYDATIKRLNGTSSQGEKVAALVDFAKVICPAMANGGRLAGLLRQYPPVQVLAAMWDVAPKKLAGDSLSYVQRTLEGRKQRDTAKAGRGAIRGDADLDACERA